MSATAPLRPDPRRFPIRLPRPMWIGLATVVLIAIAVGIFRNSRKAHLAVPNIDDIQSVEADFYDSGKHAKVTFKVPAAHWQPIFSALLPAHRDSDPSKWVGLGHLQIKLVGGGSFHVSLYSVSDGLGAFSSGPNFEQRVYYRGGSSADLKQALSTAFEAVEKNP